MLPLGRVRRGEGRSLDAARVVDQDAYARQPPGRIDGDANTGPGGDIRADERSADLRGCGLTSAFVKIGDDHVHAGGGQPPRDPCAYPFRASCDHSGHFVQAHAGIVRLGYDNSARAELAGRSCRSGSVGSLRVRRRRLIRRIRSRTRSE